MVREGWIKRRQSTAIKIELAALELLLEEGDEHISIKDVAARLGISMRTVYRYHASVHDALVAAPLRSLQRIADEVRARPDSENLREAFSAAMVQGEVSDSIQLIARIARKHPLVWRRVVAQMQPSSIDFFESMVADRLRRGHRDTRLARLIAGVLVAVVENQEITDADLTFEPLEIMLNRVIEALAS